MSAPRLKLLLGALLCALLVLPAGQASARKVGNPGNFTTTLTGGTFRIKNSTFNLADVNPDPTFAGTVLSNGTVNFPTSGISFPPLHYDTGQGIVTIRLQPTHAWTGNLNTITGDMTLRARFKLKMEGDLGPGGAVNMGSNCYIGSDSNPIDANVLTTGITNPPGPNSSINGTEYNPSNGTTSIVNNSFSVPGASGCTDNFLANVNSEINGALGLPSSGGNNEVRMNLTFSPIATKAVHATFTATPSSGTAPLNPTFNPSGSSAAGGIAQCVVPTPATPNCGVRWDFNGDGLDDQVTNSLTNVSNNYLIPGTYQARLRVFDVDGDFDQTTRQITVNAPPPDLTINKSHSGNFLAGTQETYNLSVSNIGSGATQGTTTVTDTLPAGLTYVSATGSGWSCSAAGQTVTCNRAALINGGGTTAPTITLTVNVAANAAASVTNTAAVTTAAGTSPELVVNNNSDSDPTTVDRVDMGITKTAAGTFETGTVESYNLALANNGSVPTTGTTTVTDVLSSSLTYVGSTASAGWTCGAAGQTVTCTRAAGIPVGPAGSIQIDVTAGSTAVPAVNNSASVSTPNDSNTLNDSSLIATPVTATVDLTIEKNNGSAFRVGSSANYTLAVQNRGAKTTGTGSTTTVSDTLPAGLTPTGASGTGWSCNVNGQDVSCTSTEALEANENAGLITIQLTVGAAALPPGQDTGTVNNTATVATSGTGLDADVNPGNNSDTVTTTITATDLTIDKSHVGGFPLGGLGSYTLSVRNDGSAPTVGTTTVTDTLPAELSYVNAAGSGWSCGVAGQVVTCTRTASIDADQTAPPITLQVDVADTDDEETINTASVSTADDVNAANDSDTDPTPLTAADLALTKSHSGNFRVGADKAYVIRIENVGSQPTTGTTTVTDTLPAGLAYVNATGSGWSCGATGQVVTCTRANAIASGADAPPITVQTHVNPAAFPAVTNNAVVSNVDDRNDANDSGSDPTTVTASDLAAEKTHQGTVKAGDRATYLVKVTNVGTTDTNSPTTITDTLPASLTYAGSPSPDWSCSNAGQLVTCEYSGTIPAGDSTGSTLELRADVATGAPTQLTNTATVSSAGDPNSANNQDSDTADVGRIDLAIDKSHTGSFTRGGSGAYTLTVENDGTDPSEGVTRVTDTLPAGLAYAGASGTDWSCSISSGTVECTHPDVIGAGEQAPPITLNVDVSPTAAAQVTNTASVSGADEVDSSDNSDSDLTTTVSTSDVAGSIRAQVPSPNGSFRVGTNGTYNIAVRNTGSSTLTGGVTASVDLPNGLAYEDFSGAGWTCGASIDGASCTHAGDMASETRSDITLEVAVTKQAAPGVTTGLTVANAADPTGPDNTDSEFTTVKMIDLAIAMQHAGTFALNTPSTFTINVENVGSTGTIAATRVVDQLPAGLAFNGGSGNGWACSASGQLVICAHQGLLASGEQADPLTLTVTPQAGIAGQQLTNTADVVGQDDGEAANNSASDPFTVGPAPAPPQQQVKGKTCKKKKGKKGKKCKKKKGK